MPISPTQLTLRHLRAEGWLAEVTEHWNPHAGVRNDLFGFIDVIAIKPNETLAVQATTAANVMSRVHKIADQTNISAVREAGWGIEVWGWAKKSGRWVLHRRIDVS